MILVAVMYPNGPDATFDSAYYLDRHMPLVRERWAPLGLTDMRVVRGLKGGDGAEPPYSTMALLTFRSLADFQAAGAAHGAELFGDIPNFTNTQPVVQVSEIVL